MTVFNQIINAGDADWFMSLSCGDKKKWIKENTNQQNDGIIDEFLKTLRRGKDDECDGCKKQKANGQRAEIVTEVTGVEQPSDIAGHGDRGNDKGGDEPEKPKRGRVPKG